MKACCCNINVIVQRRGSEYSLCIWDATHSIQVIYFFSRWLRALGPKSLILLINKGSYSTLLKIYLIQRRIKFFHLGDCRLWVLSDRWCWEAGCGTRCRGQEREQVVFCSERDWGTCHLVPVHLATDVRHLARTLTLLAWLLTHLAPGGCPLTSDTMSVSAMQQGHNLLWHFSAPPDMSSDKNISQVACLWSLPPGCTKCRHSTRHCPVTSERRSMLIWDIELFVTTLFHIAAQKYICSDPGKFWSDEKSCIVAFYVFSSKEILYWMLKNNAIPKYLGLYNFPKSANPLDGSFSCFGQIILSVIQCLCWLNNQ